MHKTLRLMMLTLGLSVITAGTIVALGARNSRAQTEQNESIILPPGAVAVPPAADATAVPGEPIIDAEATSDFRGEAYTSIANGYIGFTAIGLPAFSGVQQGTLVVENELLLDWQSATTTQTWIEIIDRDDTKFLVTGTLEILDGQALFLVPGAHISNATQETVALQSPGGGLYSLAPHAAVIVDDTGQFQAVEVTAPVTPEASVPKPGHWEGSDPSVSFDVSTDGSVANFAIEVEFVFDACRISMQDAMVPDRDGSFEVVTEYMERNGKTDRNQLAGEFTSTTTAAGDIQLEYCGMSDGGAMISDLGPQQTTWTAVWQDSTEDTQATTPTPTVEAAAVTSGAAIEGTLTNQTGGGPLPDADVILYTGIESDSTINMFPPPNRILARTTTDTDGHYIFTQVNAGLYGLVFSTELPNLGNCALTVGFFNYFQVTENATLTLDYEFPSSTRFAAVEPGYLNITQMNFYGCE